MPGEHEEKSRTQLDYRATDPDVIVDTEQESVDACVDKILLQLGFH